MTKQKSWVDSIGNDVKEGDWVSYLIPSSRILNIGPVVGGTDKSLRLIDIDFYQLGRRRFTCEPTLTREFKLCVRIEPPIEKIMSNNKKSMFCFGVVGFASGWSLDNTIQKSISVHTDFRSDFQWKSADEVEEIRESGIAAGWYWYKLHQKG